MTPVKSESVADAIVQLAEEIARLSPDCASRAMQIVDLARSLDSEPDQRTVEDALDAEMTDDGISGISTRNAAAAVVKALK